MRLSIVIAVLNSHEILRRQILHWSRLSLPEDIEWIIVDDGSDPPLTGQMKNLRFHQTNDPRPWTQPIARNIGVGLAQGEYVLCTDIDHILSEQLIRTVYETPYDVVRFKREAGVLEENGVFTQDRNIVKSYGYIPSRMRMPAHGNSYGIRRDLFIRFGGSQQRTRYPNRDEQKIKRWIHRLGDEVKVIPDDQRPTIYMIPNGRYCGDKDFNPFNLFHNLSRKHVG